MGRTADVIPEQLVSVGLPRKNNSATVSMVTRRTGNAIEHDD